MTLEKMEEMQNMDIKTIDPDSVVNYDDISVNTNLPTDERMLDVARQMNGNPYFFKTNKILVKMSYAETDITFGERMEDYLRTI